MLAKVTNIWKNHGLNSFVAGCNSRIRLATARR